MGRYEAVSAITHEDLGAIADSWTLKVCGAGDRNELLRRLEIYCYEEEEL